MSPERSKAYKRVMRTLETVGPSKLLDSEQNRIRYAADNLIFSRSLLEDVEAREALQDVEHLCEALVQSGRWEQVSATRLVVDVAQCGPAGVPALHAA